MKKLIVFAAAALAATPALASKARVEALGNSRQLTDVQYVFDRPYLLHSVGEQVTLEWGAKNGTANSNKAEGGIITNLGGGVFGLYLGRQGFLSEQTLGTNQIKEQNPINLMYGMKSGDIAWGLNLGYSNGKNEGATGAPKTSSTDLVVGAEMGQWSVDLGMSLSGKAESTTAAETKVKANNRLGVDYKISDSMYAYGTYSNSEIDGGAKVTAMSLGYVNTLVKNEEANFFYGVAYSSNKIDAGTETTTLPVWIGVEANANSWMVMRASVSQNILINEEKAANGNKTDTDSIAFAAGAGFKLGKGMLDATFGTATAGHLSFTEGSAAGDKFLGKASYTYNF